MTRGRLATWIETAREDIEGDLASLGVARVLIDLASARAENALTLGGISALDPIGEDLQRAGILINRVQNRLKERFEEVKNYGYHSKL